MNKTVDQIVASIEAGDFEFAANEIVKTPAPERAKILAETIGFMDLKMFSLRQQLDEAQATVAKYQELEDAYAGPFIDAVCMSIKDAQSALQAGKLYGKVWFSDLEFSMPVKVAICRRLIDTVAPYNPTYVSGLWQNVVDAVPGALDAIQFNTNDESER